MYQGNLNIITKNKQTSEKFEFLNFGMSHPYRDSDISSAQLNSCDFVVSFPILWSGFPVLAFSHLHGSKITLAGVILYVLLSLLGMLPVMSSPTSFSYVKLNP